MTTDLSPSGIQRLLEMADKAKRGPWHVEKDSDDIAPLWCVCHPDTVCNATTVANFFDGDNGTAEFVAEARAALPDALREIENLTAMLNTQRAVNCSVSRGYSATKGVNTKIRDDNKSLRDRIAALEKAIQWALGEGDSDFGDNKPTNPGPFWWREELSRRAILSGGNGK